jgi:type III secretory pathway component EscT
MDFWTYFFIVLAVLIFAALIWLEIVLSKKKNKWLGLILPAVVFCIAISAMFVTPAYVTRSAGTVTEQSITQSGEVIEKIITQNPQTASPSAGALIMTAVYLFMLYNIPTAVLLMIYAVCRVKFKKQAEIDKMNIQDLS